MYTPGPVNNLRANSTNYAIRAVMDQHGNKWLLAMDVAALFSLTTHKMLQMVDRKDKIQANLRAHLTIPVVSAHMVIENGVQKIVMAPDAKDEFRVLPQTMKVRPGKTSTHTVLGGKPADENPVVSGPGNFSNVWLINPRGMSHVIMRSKHERAQMINDWMYDTVLPSLILHGRYVVDEGELADIRAMIVDLKVQVEKLTEDRDLLQRENKILWEHSDMRLGDLAGH